MRGARSRVTRRVAILVCSALALAGTVLLASRPPQDAASQDGVPLTYWLANLLTVRFTPQALDDNRLIQAVVEQVSAEQQLWQRFGRSLEARGTGRWSRRLFGQSGETSEVPLLHEWQALAEESTAVRDLALMYFLNPAASAPRIADVFLFSRSSVEGREPRFAARELISVYRRHLELASAKAPTNIWMTLPLPKHAYDFQTGSIRFYPMGFDPFFASAEAAAETLARTANQAPQGVEIAARLSSEMAYGQVSLPAGANDAANYSLGRLPEPDERVDSPTNDWRSGVARLLSGGVLAADRQFRLAPIPLDLKVAEALSFREARRESGAGLQARVVMTVRRADVGSVRVDRETLHRYPVLFVNVRRVDIIGPDNEVLRTVAGPSLPAPR